MARVTWLPEVCACCISWTPDEAGAPTDLFVERVCPSHASLLRAPLVLLQRQRGSILAVDDGFRSLYAQVLLEQQAKDTILVAMLRAVPRWRHYLDAEGNVSPIARSLYEVVLSGTGTERHLRVRTTLDPLTPAERFLARDAARAVLHMTTLTVDVT